MKQDLISLIKGAGIEIIKFYDSQDFLLKKGMSPLNFTDQTFHFFMASKSNININQLVFPDCA
jgi:hypothetical protein